MTIKNLYIIKYWFDQSANMIIKYLNILTLYLILKSRQYNRNFTRRTGGGPLWGSAGSSAPALGLAQEASSPSGCVYHHAHATSSN